MSDGVGCKMCAGNMPSFNFFIPGYTGFCPYMRDRIGRTYSKTTFDVLDEYPWITGRLSPIGQRRALSYPVVNEPLYRDDRMAEKIYDHQCTGYPKLPSFIPGYTGHIPTNLARVCTQCERRYTEDGAPKMPCKSATYTVHPPQRIPEGTVVAPRVINSCCDKCSCKPCKCSEAPNIYKGLSRCPEHVSDLITTTGHQQTSPLRAPSMIRPSSSAGRLPLSYEENQAQQRQNMSTQVPERLRMPRSQFAREAGVIPNYTGFIPGYQWSYAETYGRATRRLLADHFDQMRQGY